MCGACRSGERHYRICNYVQFGHAIMSVLGLQLCPLLLCNKQLRAYGQSQYQKLAK